VRAEERKGRRVVESGATVLGLRCGNWPKALCGQNGAGGGEALVETKRRKGRRVVESERQRSLP